MKVNYNVEIPKSDAEDINLLYKFIEDDEHKNVKLTYDNVREASIRRGTLAKVIDREKFKVSIKRIGVDVYLEKMEK